MWYYYKVGDFYSMDMRDFYEGQFGQCLRLAGCETEIKINGEWEPLNNRTLSRNEVHQLRSRNVSEGRVYSRKGFHNAFVKNYKQMIENRIDVHDKQTQFVEFIKTMDYNSKISSKNLGIFCAFVLNRLDWDLKTIKQSCKDIMTFYGFEYSDEVRKHCTTVNLNAAVKEGSYSKFYEQVQGSLFPRMPLIEIQIFKNMYKT